VALQIERLVKDQFHKPSDHGTHGVTKYRRHAWARKKGHVERLRERLEKTRLSIVGHLARGKYVHDSNLATQAAR
jgi:hypothetical protein